MEIEVEGGALRDRHSDFCPPLGGGGHDTCLKNRTGSCFVCSGTVLIVESHRMGGRALSWSGSCIFISSSFHSELQAMCKEFRVHHPSSQEYFIVHQRN